MHSLLTLSPSSGNLVNNRAIHGSLRVTSIDEVQPPSFTALSYVWGQKATASHKIILAPGGFCLEVTTGRFTALADLLTTFGAIAIWVDAICINQKDDQEKGSQNPLMKDIYTIASTVYVLLSEGSEETDKAVDYLKILAKTRRRIPYEVIVARKPVKEKRLVFKAALRTLKDSVSKFHLVLSDLLIPPPQKSI